MDAKSDTELCVTSSPCDFGQAVFPLLQFPRPPRRSLSLESCSLRAHWVRCSLYVLPTRCWGFSLNQQFLKSLISPGEKRIENVSLAGTRNYSNQKVKDVVSRSSLPAGHRNITLPGVTNLGLAGKMTMEACQD